MEDQQSTEPKTFSEQEVEEIVGKAINKALHEVGESERKKSHSFFRDPVWQFVGAILALIAIAVAFYIFFLQREIKSARITILANTSLTQISDAVASDIQLLYKGNPVPGLSLLQIKLENDGNVEIRSEDYESPITLIFPSGATVVDAAVVESKPENLRVDVSRKDNEATLSNALLNPGDRIVLRFFVVEPSNQPLTLDVDARIAGLSDMPIETALQQRSGSPISTALIASLRERPGEILLTLLGVFIALFVVTMKFTTELRRRQESELNTLLENIRRDAWEQRISGDRVYIDRREKRDRG